MLYQKTGKNPQLHQIEKELCSFYEYCEASGFTKEEMEDICKPLTSIIRKTKVKDYLLNVVIVAALFLLVYCFTETISWNICAVGRIIMVQILPFLNWEKFSNEKCLVPNYFAAKEPQTTARHFDCNLCEAIDVIAREIDVDPEHLSEVYLDVNVPVVITDGLRNYPSVKKADFNITEAILLDRKLRTTYPCETASNIISHSVDISTILLKSFLFKKWFIHFQNCALNAVKQFRLYAPRPYFLRPEILPVQYSWLLMSANYKSKYKKIELMDKIAVFGQIQGSNYVKLTPRLNCLTECPTLEIELQKNEAVVFNSLWDLEYKPNHLTHNIAVILETH